MNKELDHCFFGDNSTISKENSPNNNWIAIYGKNKTNFD